jgi:putative membrane protein
MGGIYGGLAEYCPPVRSSFGTTIGSALFTGADLIGVPVLNLGPAPTEQPKSALASPVAAHIIYGVTTELVRRIVRAVL